VNVRDKISVGIRVTLTGAKGTWYAVDFEDEQFDVPNAPRWQANGKNGRWTAA
jgi:hypothetical protein